LKPERWGSPLVQLTIREERSVTRYNNNNNIIIIIIIIIILPAYRNIVQKKRKKVKMQEFMYRERYIECGT